MKATLVRKPTMNATVLNYFKAKGYSISFLTKHHLADILLSKDAKQLPVKIIELEEQPDYIYWEVQQNKQSSWGRLKYTPDSKIKIVFYLPESRQLWIFPAKDLSNVPYHLFNRKARITDEIHKDGFLIPKSFLQPKCKIIQL